MNAGREIRERSSVRGVACVVGAALAVCSAGGAALAERERPDASADKGKVTEVIAVGKGAGGVDSTMEGLAWQYAGFLDEYGAPYEIDARTGNIVVKDARGRVVRVVGKVITRRERAIGWVNEERRRAVIYLDRGTMQDVFGYVAEAGKGRVTIHVARHGAVTWVPATRGQPGRWETGAGIRLDNDTVYAGFESGTGFNRGLRPGTDGKMHLAVVDAYPHIKVDYNDSVTMRFLSCYSTRDPDGHGPMRSVCSTALEITKPGRRRHTVDEVIGTSMEATVKLVAEIVGGGSRASYDALVRKKNRVATVEDWLYTLSFDRMHSELSRRFHAVRWKLSYHEVMKTSDCEAPRGLEPDDEGPDGMPEDDGEYPRDFLTVVFPDQESRIDYVPPSGRGPGADLLFDRVSDEDELPGGEVLHLVRLSEPPVPPPDGLVWVTGVFELLPVDGYTAEAIGTASLNYLPNTDLDTLDLYELDRTRNEWVRLGDGENRRIDEENELVSVEFAAYDLLGNEGFVVAGFAEPSECLGMRRCDPTCDDVKNGDDVVAFELAILDVEAYRAEHPGCDPLCTMDMNDDGRIDEQDRDPFIACVSTSGFGN